MAALYNLGPMTLRSKGPAMNTHGMRFEASGAAGEPRENALALLCSHRRALHRIPELGFELPLTTDYVRRQLEGLSCSVFEPSPSCVCAHFDAGSRRTIAIRADMDALPICEKSAAPFPSELEGRMHACGHDAHMAMVLTLAGMIDGALVGGGEGRPSSNVLLVFQPAEETTGGAKTVCDSGVFERYRVSAIYGFHVWPDLPAGTVASRPGPLFARSSETHIDIKGASAHIATTYGVDDEDSHDAMLAAARFIEGARDLKRRLGEREYCIVKFGLLNAGSVCNAVAGDAHIEGSLRVFSQELFDAARDGVRACLDRACASTGCSYQVSFAQGYPPVANDAELFAAARSVVPGMVELESPSLTAEDFSFYQQRVPGLFMLLGVGAPAESGVPPISPLHADDFYFDEEPLLHGVDAYCRLLGMAGIL